MPRQPVPIAVKPEQSAKMANHFMALPKLPQSRNVNRKSVLPPIVKRWQSVKMANHCMAQPRPLQSKNAKKIGPLEEPARNNNNDRRMGNSPSFFIACRSAVQFLHLPSECIYHHRGVSPKSVCISAMTTHPSYNDRNRLCRIASLSSSERLPTTAAYNQRDTFQEKRVTESLLHNQTAKTQQTSEIRLQKHEIRTKGKESLPLIKAWNEVRETHMIIASRF